MFVTVFIDWMIMEMKQEQCAGYAFLVKKYELKVLPHRHISLVGSGGVIRSRIHDGQEESIFPPSYWPGDSIGDHLEFALKYDGVNLGILSLLFAIVAQEEITSWIISKPTGKYVRKIWFFFELLTGKKLPIDNLRTGNYIDLLETDRYYTAMPGERAKRYRIIDNLLGSKDFCPVIRRTERLAGMESIDIRQLCDDMVKSYPPDLLRRALGYLYGKETKSSFEIERLKPSVSRTERFISLLETATHKDFCERQLLIDVQNRIVDAHFRDDDYRVNQNYIGQRISLNDQRIHYVCPKPEDLPALMSGLILSHKKMMKAGVPAVIHAAAISYGFVYMHPFEDGNGRIHRFLIHNILFLKNAVPRGLMFPVSAAMLKNPDLYDLSLEVFSKPLMGLVKYDLDHSERMTVRGETGHLYRYIDMTSQAEALYEFVRVTIEEELTEELSFLADYDTTRSNIQEIVDMPDRLLDLFIKLCMQNHGRLSDRKKESHFSLLTEDELTSMEQVVQQHLYHHQSSQ